MTTCWVSKLNEDTAKQYQRVSTLVAVAGTPGREQGHGWYLRTACSTRLLNWTLQFENLALSLDCDFSWS